MNNTVYDKNMHDNIYFATVVKKNLFENKLDAIIIIKDVRLKMGHNIIIYLLQDS